MRKHPLFIGALNQMATITSIFYRENRVSVTLDSGETFHVSYSAVSSVDLSRDRELSTEAYGFLRDEAERFSCREKALAYLAMRQHSEMEIRRYLAKKKFNPQAIDETVIFLKEKNYVNDHEFAVAYARSLVAKKPAGKLLVKSRLYEKGIRGNLADKAMKDAGCNEDDLKAITDLARKKLATFGNDAAVGQKIYRYLASRGFCHDTIRAVLRTLLAGKGGDEEFPDD